MAKKPARRKAKRHNVDADRLMERTRAARAIVNAQPNDKELELMAFMAVVECRPIDRATARLMLER